ncbi:MAG: hypothetical protein IJL92_08915 [Thermoguttaceae bacterium]|nr:hypothetical protein [Thermoguttaceae bacterium]
MIEHNHDADEAQAQVGDGFLTARQLLGEAHKAFDDNETNKASFLISCVISVCYEIDRRIEIYEKALTGTEDHDDGSPSETETVE